MQQDEQKSGKVMSGQHSTAQQLTGPEALEGSLVRSLIGRRFN